MPGRDGQAGGAGELHQLQWCRPASRQLPVLGDGVDLDEPVDPQLVGDREIVGGGATRAVGDAAWHKYVGVGQQRGMVGCGLAGPLWVAVGTVVGRLHLALAPV
ncbi:hypothetical protein [Streptomyces melanogenes]|uniref:hypothetical protein n=1 Tax=Streptomyces melanogenes TaxID=67326 RepID=UPI00379BF920